MAYETASPSGTRCVRPAPSRWGRDLRQQPAHGEKPAPAECRPVDRIQPLRGRSGAAEGQGRRFLRQSQARRLSATRAPARDALHAGDDGQHRFQGRRPLSGGQLAGDGPRDRRDARRCARPPILHHLDRLWASIGKNIALAYLPWEYAREGRELLVQYFGDAYPVEVAAVGYKALYDPENVRPRS